MPRACQSQTGLLTRVLRLRLKDKHAAALREKSYLVNMVWNYCNDLSFKVWERERRFMSGYDFAKYTKGAGKAGIPLHSQTIQAISEEFAARRKQSKKLKLRWRVSRGPRRSLGWVPFKATALSYRNGQLWMSGIHAPLCLWDSYGLAKYALGAGSISEDARGRWYINISVKLDRPAASRMERSIGIDLGLKDFASTSDGEVIEVQHIYRDAEARLATAQRAGKKRIVRNIHAKIANKRRDFNHKLSARLVVGHGAIFVGNVNAGALAKTRMAKSVSDAGWSQFRTMLSYKCDSAGVWFDEVNEAYSTQDCSACFARSGPKGLQDLGVREWTCLECGEHHHRDVNAAKNILRRGRATLVVGIPVL
ncbi:RNA-guided endonuclease InsQ/TnpB family protein [Massilia cavernae]|uniref:Transposase n=1 Tax=Massilia cavernae TaxID=2320864 RepID=A0A418XAL0_9BURK|nr:RNA-guided endonuclease TnpB family protein [Massilia cavernae]RJG09542.1 transposase [Massilia cavernae]